MQYVYAAMLLHKCGKPINEENMEKVLSATGIEVDKARIKATVAALTGVDIDKVIKEAAITPAATPAAAPAVAPKQEKKKEPKDEKKTEEEAAAGLGALFG